ncbi:ABC-2 type transport system permease protein [Psychromicrobium silvestre]|uniref:ABC-2 type transport system permease protein n=1 Tax=Psychromicrobium silvestre TaxID=1645614 RepID=A0A7Y9S738_9MICC|nr:ABC transporter permease [Psychromicrobium silvestre]NYE95345.1 ABC-2 type transport system permease protein [Psychromicrobium silvestre]
MKYLVEYVRIQFLELLRLPSFFLPLVALPAVFYLMAGARSGPLAGISLFSYLAFAIMGTMMFQFGVGIAANRNDPWNLYLLTLPASSRLRIGSQLLTGLVFAVLFALPLLAIGLFNGALLSISPAGLGMGAAALLIGGVVHGALGLALGYWLPVRGATPITSLLYFPLSFVGGLFGPVDLGALQVLHDFSPTGAWTDLIAGALAGSVPWRALLVLGIYFLLCGTAAVLGYRRVEQTQYR